MDEADFSQEIVAESTAAAIRRVVRAANSGQASRQDCLDCGQPIPAKRQDAVPGVQLCINCQSRMEARS